MRAALLLTVVCGLVINVTAAMPRKLNAAEDSDAAFIRMEVDLPSAKVGNKPVTVNQLQSEANEDCAPDGEDCGYEVMCCSGSCNIFTRKCGEGEGAPRVENKPAEVKQPESEANADCAPDGEDCGYEVMCCSGSCNIFTRKCGEGESASKVENKPAEVKQPESGTNEDCAPDGEDCGYEVMCCSGSCNIFTRKCGEAEGKN
jgi:hypothetical protein